MDINSSTNLISTPLRPATARPGLREPNAERTVPSPAEESSAKLLATPDQLREKEREAQALRVQRVNNSESLPLNTQKALSQYQQNQSASPDTALGELAGIDVFA